ncbi:MAG: hypothetical protein Q8P90_00915 [bacterium]|nr:hypothetical protein [bacterium]
MRYWQRIKNQKKKSINFYLKLFGIIFFIASFVVPSVSYAELDNKDAGVYIPGPSKSYLLEQPLGGAGSVANIGEYIQLVYSYALGIVGIMAVVIIMFGGYRWISAAGNEQTITSAKEMIVSAVTGLLIALMSYTILVFINPSFIQLKFRILEIPVFESCPRPDGMSTIPPMKGWSGGATACGTLIDDFTKVLSAVTADGGSCPSCTISGSCWRSSDTQLILRDCFERAVEEGYRTEKGVPIKDGCPDGCSGCNLALEPICTGNTHLAGRACDLCLTYAGSDASIAPTSCGFLSQKYNGGGGDDKLLANQNLLNSIMTSSYDGKTYFSPFGPYSDGSGEWWHYNYKGGGGECASSNTGLACTGRSADGITASENAFCTTTKNDGTVLYRHATCSSGQSACATSFGGYTWSVFGSNCALNQFVSFDGVESAGSPTQTYLAAPNCAS